MSVISKASHPVSHLTGETTSPDRPIVCVGFAEALAGPEVVWSLAQAGFRVAAFARRGRATALRKSRYVRVFDITPPEQDLDQAARDLANLLQNLRDPTRPTQAWVFPLDDAAVALTSRPGSYAPWNLIGPTGPLARLALDKPAQLAAARKAGFEVPEFWHVTHPKELQALRPHLPLILKSAEAIVDRGGRLGKGRNWICGNEAEWDRALSQWKGAWPLIVQRYIPGVGEGVFGLASDRGLHVLSAHRRLRMMNPHGSGSSACASQPVHADLRILTERFVRETGWRGLFMIELLRDTSGKLWFMELNGRPWGSTALSRRQGLEYPAWAAEFALNPSAIPSDPPSRGSESMVCRNLGREWMHLLFVVKGPKSSALQEWPHFGTALRDLCQFDSQHRFYNWNRNDPKVFLYDTWYTLRDNLVKTKG